MPVMDRVQTGIKVGFETMMVATDLTAISERALDYARAMALESGSKLHLVHVHDPSKVYSYPEAILGLPEVEGVRQCDEALQSLERSCLKAGLKARTTTIEGHSPASTLLKMAHEEHVDLLVAGTQSKHGFERLLLGSVAERLIREADCPVLTVGPKAAEPPPGPLTFRRILFATDFSSEAGKAAAYAFSLAMSSGGELHCCYVRTLKSQTEEVSALSDGIFERALERLFPEGGHELCHCKFVVEHGSAAETILKVAAEEKIDLIVMGASRPVFWLSEHKPGLSPSVLAEAECPVLTCGEKCR